MVDDKRLIPEFSGEFWAHRHSERDWSYCKYCVEQAPTFQLAEGVIGSSVPVRVLRCCWQCGSGLEVLPTADCLLAIEQALFDLEEQANGGLG